MFRRRPISFIVFLGTVYVIPYFSIRTYYWLDQLSIWNRRIEEKRVEKIAFDFMLKNLTEKERDLLEEFSDY